LRPWKKRTKINNDRQKVVKLKVGEKTLSFRVLVVGVIAPPPPISLDMWCHQVVMVPTRKNEP
jgi:hypothetical protein